MSEIPKRRFEFPKQEGRVDLYLDGKKVVNGHRGETGNYYFRIPSDAEVDFQVAEHDSGIPTEAEVTPTGLKPIERKPKFVQERDIEVKIKTDDAKKLAEEIQAKQAAAEKERILAAKQAREAELARLEAEKAKRDAEKTE